MPLIDLRHEQTNPPKTTKQRHKMRRGRVVERDPRTVNGIVVHQTACVYGPRGDNKARERRALGSGSHCVAFRHGNAVLGNPLRWYVWGGNDFNETCLHLEVEGHYPGLPDDPTTPRREDIESTWGHAPTPLDDRTFRAACEGLEALVHLGRAEGMPLEWIYAHRQSSASRRSDPGWELWDRLVLGYAVPVLGLRTNPSLVLEDGRPIPPQWDPQGSGRY